MASAQTSARSRALFLLPSPRAGTACQWRDSHRSRIMEKLTRTRIDGRREGRRACTRKKIMVGGRSEYWFDGLRKFRSPSSKLVCKFALGTFVILVNTHHKACKPDDAMKGRRHNHGICFALLTASSCCGTQHPVAQQCLYRLGRKRVNAKTSAGLREVHLPASPRYVHPCCIGKPFSARIVWRANDRNRSSLPGRCGD